MLRTSGSSSYCGSVAMVTSISTLPCVSKRSVSVARSVREPVAVNHANLGACPWLPVASRSSLNVQRLRYSLVTGGFRGGLIPHSGLVSTDCPELAGVVVASVLGYVMV
ncbi:MAG TPA: hypothetical protein VI485_04880 [Vicinamibacterales bacterium]|nr:hypothetical protein [Vicinamibacterales bacterium]